MKNPNEYSFFNVLNDVFQAEGKILASLEEALHPEFLSPERLSTDLGIHNFLFWNPPKCYKAILKLHNFKYSY